VGQFAGVLDHVTGTASLLLFARHVAQSPSSFPTVRPQSIILSPFLRPPAR
jgi:hypothetical protein